MTDQSIKPNVSQIDFDDINTFIKFLNNHANHTLVKLHRKPPYFNAVI